MAKFCSNCGSPISREGASFCTSCGAKLPVVSQKSTAPAAENYSNSALSSPAPSQAQNRTAPAKSDYPPQKSEKTVRGKKSKIIIPIAIVVIVLLLLASFVLCFIKGYFGLDALKEKLFPEKTGGIVISADKLKDKDSEKESKDDEDDEDDEKAKDDDIAEAENKGESEADKADEAESSPEPSEEPAPEQETTAGEEPIELPFLDIEGHWAEDAVRYAYENKLFSGVSETEFRPGMNMTRYMLMTVLARLDGVDTSGGKNWYDKGMEWTIENGISDGSNGEADITREQMITMLWRYAGKPQGSFDFSGYEDKDSISSWAEEALCWAASEGLMKGRSETVLAPGGTATRAEVATILKRYSELNK